MKVITTLVRIATFFSFTVASITCANAALELELTKGVDSAIPIAIAAFSNESTNENQQLSAIIKQDLQNSGRFRAIENNINSNSPDLNAARQAGADDVIVGQVASLGDGRLRVNFKLLDPLGGNHTIVTKEFTIRSAEQRALAHHISDIVYQQLTGDRGIFSTRIAYVLVQQTAANKNRYLLEVADADGYNPRTLLNSAQPIMSPSWSPDAKQIAYVSFERNTAEIYRANVVTGQRTVVTSFEGINGAPSWSPDGKQLAVVLSKSGSPKIYVMNAQGGGLRQVTNGVSIDTEPNWSPDGRSLLFTSNRGGSPQIYRLDLASGQVDRVTFDGNYNARPLYTPQGKEIVVLHQNGDQFNIAVQDVASGTLKSVTDSMQDESPSVAPNGKMILYSTRFDGKGVLSVVSIDGNVRLRLPAREGDVQEPAWSPFIS